MARRPSDALANSQLGLTYFDLSSDDLAEKYLKAAIQLDPAHFSHPQVVLAHIYLRKGDRESALSVLRGFVEQPPDAPEAESVRSQIGQLSH